MFDTNAFKEKLDNTHQWPNNYKYKFIVPSEEKLIQQVKDLFYTETTIVLKKSSNNKYTSITAKQIEENSDAVIELYTKAQTIQGLIAL